MTASAPDVDWGALLDGRVAVITGAGSGQGRAAALLFGAHGASVVAVDIDVDGAEETLAMMSGASTPGVRLHMVVRADVSRAAEVNQMIDNVMRTHRRLDVLYNNAALQMSGRLVDCTDDDWDRTIATNLSAIFYACRAAIPHMLAGDGGSIISTASVMGYVGAPGYAAYGPSKAGLVTLMRQIALEYGPTIRANIIAPGGIETPRFRKAHADEPDYDGFVQRLTAHNPARRLGQPDDVARIALFLASDASAYLSGAVIPADGGLAAMR